MCLQDYWEDVEHPSRSQARQELVCPAQREKRLKALENEVVSARRKRDNERWLIILERASRLWTVKDQTPR